MIFSISYRVSLNSHYPRARLREIFFILALLCGFFLPVTGFGQESKNVLASITIDEAWAKANNALDAQDFTGAQSAFEELDSVRFLYGVSDLEEISLHILSEAQKLYEIGDKEHALYLLGQADRFAAQSPRLRLQSLGLRSRLREVRFASEIRLILAGTLASPHAILHSLASLSYPVLWALTIGFFMLFFGLFVLQKAELLEAFLLRFRLHNKTFLGVFLLLSALLSPIFLGPVWTLLTWGLILRFCVSRIPRIVFLMLATLLCCWALLIPLTGSLHAWLRAPAFQSMMQVAQGGARGADRAFLENLSLEYPQDAALHYTRGQLERRDGRLHEARSSFEKAQSLLPHSQEILAQLALLDFLEGDNSRALEGLLAAEKKGLHSAEFYFNFSKVQFALLETDKNADLLRKAYQIDPERTKIFEKREEILGSNSPKSIAEIPLPWSVYLTSALQFQTSDIAESGKRKFAALGFGISQGILFFLAFGFVFLTSRGKSLSPRLLYSEEGVSTSGGSLSSLIISFVPLAAPIAHKRLLLPFFGYTTFFLCLFPVFRWPVGADRFYEYLGPYTLLYGLLLLIVAIGLWFAGLRSREKTKAAQDGKKLRGGAKHG